MTNSPSRNRISILLFNLFFLLLLPRSLSDDTGVVGHDGQHFFGFFFASFLSLRWRRSSKSNKERERERESGWRWSHPTGSSKGPGPWNPRTATLSFDFLVCGFLGSLFCFRFFFLSFVPPLLERREHEPPMGGGDLLFQRSSVPVLSPSHRKHDQGMVFCVCVLFLSKPKKTERIYEENGSFFFFLLIFFCFFFVFFTRPDRFIPRWLRRLFLSFSFLSMILFSLIFFPFFSLLLLVCLPRNFFFLFSPARPRAAVGAIHFGTPRDVFISGFGKKKLSSLCSLSLSLSLCCFFSSHNRFIPRRNPYRDQKPPMESKVVVDESRFSIIFFWFLFFSLEEISSAKKIHRIHWWNVGTARIWFFFSRWTPIKSNRSFSFLFFLTQKKTEP